MNDLRAPATVTLALVTMVVSASFVAGCRREPTAGGISFDDHTVTLGGRVVSADQLRRGAAAYTHYCRACHGDAGDGAGISSRGLVPPPRDLRLGVYKFGAVASGQLPTDADFRRIITGGLHGTAMLAWDVPGPQLDDLIQFVKAFAPRWRTETAGDPISLAPNPWVGRDAAAQARGQRMYHGMAQCAVACHPAYVPRADIADFTYELTGVRVAELRPDLYAAVPKPSDYGVTIVPTDFTFAPLRAGETVEDIARTIAAGIGGTAMPTWKNVLPDADLWAMATYVRSLVSLRGTPAAADLHAQLRSQPAWPPPSVDGLGQSDGDGNGNIGTD